MVVHAGAPPLAARGAWEGTSAASNKPERNHPDPLAYVVLGDKTLKNSYFQLFNTHNRERGLGHVIQ